MRVASADRAAGARTGRASMRREHTTSLARCEGARGSPGAHPGQTCSAHRLAATSRSLVTGGDTAVPFARAVVIVRRRKLDGVMETVGLHDPVKTAPSSDRMRACQRYRGDSRYVAAAFIGAFFPPDPLVLHIYVICMPKMQSIKFVLWLARMRAPTVPRACGRSHSGLVESSIY